jgi:MFS transporter, PAT family, beta-lactamase induction signal transducer AmpG
MSNISTKSGSPARWVPTVYFAEGLPFVAIAVVSTLMYKGMGVSDAKIAFWTSLVMLPWTLKPIWGPLLEMFKTKKLFVVATQMIVGVCFGLLAFSLPLDGFFQYSLALFAIIAFNGATHDIAADGLYISVLSPKRQSEFVGWQGASYNTAKIFTQGLLVYVAGQLETSIGVVNAWMTVMGVFGVIMIALSLYHSRFLPAGEDAGTKHSVKEAVATIGDVVRTFFQKQYVFAGIAFIILYRFAEGQAVKIVPLFMKAAREQGGLALSTSEIGIVYGTFGVAAFVLGSILAGYFTAKRGLRRSLMILCAFFNIPFAVYAFLAIAQPTSLLAIGGAVVFEYFGYGFGFVGLTLFMMQQIAPGKYRTAHYAFATGIMSLGMLIPSMVSGFVSDWLGYRDFFIWVMVATIPSFIVTWLVPFRDTEADEQAIQG